MQLTRNPLSLPCYHPISAYRSKKGRDPSTGKWPIAFNSKEGFPDLPINLPCGQCVGCRLERSKVWATRCMHEAQLHEHNQYLTFTYDEEHLPKYNDLDKTHLQKFWKRLRKHRHKFRYYACGEYGDSTGRPHYHAICFGLRLDDLTYYRTNNGNKLYNSPELDKIWGKGNVIIGQVTFESCAYVARYIMKKTLGKNSSFAYEIIDHSTGEIIHDLTPEFTTMSRRPGIGKDFYTKYKSDMYQTGTNGQVIIRGGIKTSVPKYYESFFEEENPKRLKLIKKRRRLESIKREKDNTQERLSVKEQLALSITNNKLPRSLH